jgi:hypothetical protein
MAENKSNKQYFERALSKSLTNFGHTTLKERQKSSIRKLVLPTGFDKSYLSRRLPSTGVVF